LLESEERGIKTSEFFEGRKASTFSAKRTSLNNISIGKPILFVQNLWVIFPHPE
jgi:hypothetical protein